jgi:hypothetical protein
VSHLFPQLPPKKARWQVIRLLTPLAFVSPRIISAIMDGSAPADLTVTGLAQLLAHFWTQQERLIHTPRLRTALSMFM